MFTLRAIRYLCHNIPESTQGEFGKQRLDSLEEKGDAMKCTDCNGTKQYLGLLHYQVPEACRRCNGTGIEPGSERVSQSKASSQVNGVVHTLTIPTIVELSKRLKDFPKRVALETRKTRANELVFANSAFHIDTEAIPVTYPKGPFWIYAGARTPAQNRWDSSPLDWGSIDVPEPVAKNHAQRHYLVLYRRINLLNEFVCHWHF